MDHCAWWASMDGGPRYMVQEGLQTITLCTKMSDGQDYMICGCPVYPVAQDWSWNNIHGGPGCVMDQYSRWHQRNIGSIYVDGQGQWQTSTHSGPGLVLGQYTCRTKICGWSVCVVGQDECLTNIHGGPGWVMDQYTRWAGVCGEPEYMVGN